MLLLQLSLMCLLLLRNKYLEQMYLDGMMSLELVPQGTLVERMRAHGAGIPAFFTPTGASTTVETGGIPIRFKPGGFKNGVLIPGNKKDFKEFSGKRYIMEPAIAGDVAFIHAWRADEAGNLVFRNVANNYNNAMARNARLVIVEVRVAQKLFGTGLITELITYHVYRQKKSFRLARYHQTLSTSQGSSLTVLCKPQNQKVLISVRLLPHRGPLGVPHPRNFWKRARAAE